MSSQLADTSVRTEIVVEAPIERAFSVFTEGMSSWWPGEYHLLGEMSELFLEPGEGGHVYERASDGSEFRWARVLAYEPPTRVVISWDLTAEWQVQNDLAKTSEVEVRFIAETPYRTRVELEHRNLERHGEGWEGIRDAIGSDAGWPGCLRSFAEQLKR